MKVLITKDFLVEGQGTVPNEFGDDDIPTPMSISISIVENLNDKYVLIHLKRVSEPDSIDIISPHSLEEWKSNTFYNEEITQMAKGLIDELENLGSYSR